MSQYLGGDKAGPVVELSEPYHQKITNAFRTEVSYGNEAKVIRELKSTNPAKWLKVVTEVQKKVYQKYPIKGFK